MTRWIKSEQLLTRSKQSLAGGVSSNLRAKAKPHPLFFDHAEGAMIYDVDGYGYIDYVLGQGPLLLGHSHPALLEAVNRAMHKGQLYAGQHTLEIEVSEALVRLIPCAELCRFSLTGSEAIQAGMRLARAVTGRPTILRFEGHYHGWFNQTPPNDALDLNQAIVPDYVCLPWNDLSGVETLFAQKGHTIAAIMTEPMMCNTGVIPPAPGFLAGLRRICDEYDALLLMDEVITGFRLGLHGAQGHFGVTPDLATFAKAMAGGFANAALVGKHQYMLRFMQDVYHSGTFNSNVVSMAAAAATITELARNDGAVYDHMNEVGQALMDGIREIAMRLSIPLLVQGFPMAFHVAFTELSSINNYQDYAQHCDEARYHRFVVAMLKRGIRLIERGIWYISAVHTLNHVDKTLAAVEAALLDVA